MLLFSKLLYTVKYQIFNFKHKIFIAHNHIKLSKDKIIYILVSVDCEYYMHIKTYLHCPPAPSFTLPRNISACEIWPMRTFNDYWKMITKHTNKSKITEHMRRVRWFLNFLMLYFHCCGYETIEDLSSLNNQFIFNAQSRCKACSRMSAFFISLNNLH